MAQFLQEVLRGTMRLVESTQSSTSRGCLGTMKGPCADLKRETRNGNFYSRKLWENVFADPIVKESLEDRILIGELDHPGDGRLETKAVNACIVMTDYEFDDDNGYLIGTFDILPTPNGKILKSLIDCGCKIGVSSRGEGDVTQEEGIDVVDENSYNFVAFDAVVLPAVKAAKPALQESLSRESKSFRESLVKQVNEATTVTELNLIKNVIDATDLPDSDSLLESVNNKTQEIEGTTGSSNLLEDLERATSQINSQSEEINKLKEELTTCKSRIGKLMKSRQRLVSQIAQRDEKIKEISSEYSCSVFESSDNSRKVESLQARLSESEETIRGLRQEIRTTDSGRIKAESRVSSLEESLRKAQELVQSKNREVSRLSSKVESLKSESRKKLSESSKRGKSLSDSLSDAKKSLSESRKMRESFIKSYIEDQCKSSGLDPSVVLESVKFEMSKDAIDRLIESYVERSDRYKSLPFRGDSLIDSLGGSVSFNGSQVRVDEDAKQTADFMSEVNKLL